MTGPDHYREAERLLDESVDPVASTPDGIARMIARAQVHATLALAAAQVGDIPAWSDVLVPQRSGPPAALQPQEARREGPP